MKNTLNTHINIALIFILLFLSGCAGSIKEYESMSDFPSITPDYVNVVIPPNIAPLNFYIREKGEKYRVEIHSVHGKSIIVEQNSPSIEIPLKKWKNILAENKGNFLLVDVYVKNGNWKKYKTIKDSIVQDKIDSYLVYRLINGAYITWNKMGIYQRNLENFDQFTIFENTSTEESCVNCHMFPNNDPDKMQLHFRAVHGGTMIKYGDELRKIDTKTDKTIAAGGYPSWHPNGRLIAYSMNAVRQNFTSDPGKPQDVFDKVSDIALYDVESNTLISIPELSTSSRENLPTWSPDGKWMYFISAPGVKKNLENKTKVKYDLLRIPFNEATNTFGSVDTVLTSEETGLSMTFPVISPDGKYMLLGMTDYGYFPVYHKVSDIYLMDMETGEYRKLETNSSSTDSYHSWTSSSRWFVFSSKRLDDTYSRPFIAYIDNNGKEYKPFILPQKDPLFYEDYMQNFNRPEFVTGKVQLNTRDVRDLVLSEAEKVNFMHFEDKKTKELEGTASEADDTEYSMH